MATGLSFGCEYDGSAQKLTGDNAYFSPAGRTNMARIQASDFQDIVQAAEPRVDPDGDRIAFVRTAPDGDEEYAATLYLTDGDGDSRRFTAAEGEDSQPRFSPSGDRLAFVSVRGEAERPQLWIVPTDGGEARQVTEVVGGVSDPVWSPGGRYLAFVQRVSEEDRTEDRDLAVDEEYEREEPDPRVVDRTVYRSMQEYFDGKRSHVYLVDTAEDTVERVTTGERDYASPDWADEETLYYAVDADVADPDDSTEYEIIRHDLGVDEEGALTVDHDATTTVHTSAGVQPFVRATEEHHLACLYGDPDRTTLAQTELHVVDPETGDVAEMTADLDRTLGYQSSPQWGPEGKRLYFSTPDEGAVALWSVVYDSGAETQPDPERVLRADGASIDAAHAGPDRIAFVRSEWDHPGDLFVADADGDSQRRLTRLNEEYLDERAVAEPEELRYHPGEVRVAWAGGEELSGEHTEADRELQGWLLTPPEFDPDEEYPLVVEVHGGPHAMWTTSGTMWHEFQTLAARGYVVFWSNPRGSTGYGESFMTAIEREWGAVTTADVLAGVETVCERSFVDDEQVFLTGGSFGGYMTAWLVTHTDRFAAAVSQRGVYDLAGFYGSTDWAYELVEREFGVTPWAEPEFLAAHSPTSHVDACDTPTLLLHSETDYRTPICTAELLYRGLRKNGVDTRLVRYPGEGHELSRSGQPGHIVDRIERIARWFDGYSTHHDAPIALDRGREDGLSGGDSSTQEDNESS